MAIKVSVPACNAIVEALTTQFCTVDAFCRVYAGTQPGTAGGTVGDTLITEIAGVSWNSAVGGTTSLAGSSWGSAATDGTAGWARILNSTDETMCIDGNCGTAATCDFVIDKEVVTVGDDMYLTAADIIMPES
jgi:hypothetical protein